MEKCDGGELFAKIVKDKKFTEEDASTLTKQMLEAICFVHSMCLVHRDIKAENFLFKKKHGSTIVLIDFGMATKITDDKMLSQLCGSPHYVAPELIRRKYNAKVDMWALGVMIYLMLYGKYPFEGSDHKAIVHKILTEDPDYTRGQVHPSPLAVDFMKRLLCKQPENRMSAQEALRHAWLTPENSEERRRFDIDEAVVREAHRKSSASRIERHANTELLQKGYEKKLTQLDRRHESRSRRKPHHECHDTDYHTDTDNLSDDEMDDARAHAAADHHTPQTKADGVNKEKIFQFGEPETVHAQEYDDLSLLKPDMLDDWKSIWTD